MQKSMLPLHTTEEHKENLEEFDFIVSTCFFELEDQFLVLKRARKDKQFGLWGVPGGKLVNSESPREALEREIKEELGIQIPKNSFLFLSKAISTNPYDGQYLLYIYYYKFKFLPNITINSQEHSALDWVNIQDFKRLNLLVSQGDAFELVKSKLMEIQFKNRANQQLEVVYV